MPSNHNRVPPDRGPALEVCADKDGNLYYRYVSLDDLPQEIHDLERRREAASLPPPSPNKLRKAPPADSRIHLKYSSHRDDVSESRHERERLSREKCQSTSGRRTFRHDERKASEAGRYLRIAFVDDHFNDDPYRKATHRCKGDAPSRNHADNDTHGHYQDYNEQPSVHCQVSQHRERKRSQMATVVIALAKINTTTAMSMVESHPVAKLLAATNVCNVKRTFINSVLLNLKSIALAMVVMIALLVAVVYLTVTKTLNMRVMRYITIGVVLV